ncbi:MAG: molybdate ABC transporter substrate-binding protein [Sulfurimonas sp.]|nr:molybdate ABC transporter substrate-binding protein [Sulfurimonas sp.]
MHTLFIILIFLLFQSTLLSAEKPYKKPAIIYAAGNLKFVFPQILKVFYNKYPDTRVHIQYGASGSLTESIMDGRDYDIFFSANINYPKNIYKTKKSATKAKLYTQGVLILFTPPNSLLSKQKIQLLNSQNIKNITIANTLTSPYGLASIEVLKNSKSFEKNKNKITYSVDVATAIDNVIWRGDAGFLSKSALYMIPKDRKKEGTDWIEIDQKLYTPIRQAYVISKDGLKNNNATKFLNFIKSKTGQKIFKENGYKNILTP